MSPIREEQVEFAVRFLGNEKVKPRPTAEKEGFLARKGLLQEEIDEAFRRYDRSNGTSSPASSSQVASAIPSTPAAPVAPASPAATVPGGYPAFPQTPPAEVNPYPGVGQIPPPWPYPPGYGPPLEAQPQKAEAGAWWAWLLGGLGAGLVGTMLLNPPIRPRYDDGVDPQQGLFSNGASMQTPTAAMMTSFPNNSNLNTSDSLAKSPDTGGEPDAKASYEELLALLRQQSEEVRESAAMCAKALQTTQDQHQKTFAEMQKVLREATGQQQRSAKPQPTELSAATIQQLASLINASSATGVAQPTSITEVPSPVVAEVRPPPAAVGASPVISNPPPSATITGQAPSLRESFDSINSSLQRLVAERNTKAEATKALNTVSMILGNILKDPSSERNRKVNTTSSRFSELFRNNGAAADLLKSAGFQYQEPNFTFDGTATDAAQRTLDLLQDVQRNIDQAWLVRQSPESSTSTAVAAPAAAPIAAAAPAVATDEGIRSAPSAARPWSAASAARNAQNMSVPPAAPAPAAGVPWASAQPVQPLRQDVSSVDDSASQAAGSSSMPAASPSGPVPGTAGSENLAVAHPAERLPQQIAHPAESAAGASQQAPQQPQQPQQQQQQQQPQQQQQQQQSQQQNELPIAHPAEATVVATAPADGGVEVTDSEEPQTGG
eukprot:TRINITY_DN6418_c0_g2_i1.p1 TRINITY_DN6418_c0_g2~~TRINITY_DN6418_c0_g2_i1.p1  ORF type:complete len:666 (+),score=192.08 TRINITY_DN6418_c0_g2_i1:35-2032(+)